MHCTSSFGYHCTVCSTASVITRAANEYPGGVWTTLTLIKTDNRTTQDQRSQKLCLRLLEHFCARSLHLKAVDFIYQPRSLLKNQVPQKRSGLSFKLSLFANSVL